MILRRWNSHFHSKLEASRCCPDVVANLYVFTWTFTWHLTKIHWLWSGCPPCFWCYNEFIARAFWGTIVFISYGFLLPWMLVLCKSPFSGGYFLIWQLADLFPFFCILQTGFFHRRAWETSTWLCVLVNLKATAGGPAWDNRFLFFISSIVEASLHGAFYCIGSGYNTLWSRLVCQPIRGVHGSNRIPAGCNTSVYWFGFHLMWVIITLFLTGICDALVVPAFYRLGFSIKCYILGILLVRLFDRPAVLHLDKVSDSAGAM